MFDSDRKGDFSKMLISRGVYFRSRVTPYVILFIERDGSTYLSSMLKSHPEIHALYERFAEMRQRGADAQDQIRWAEEFFTPPLFGRYAAVGFKTKLVDVLDHEAFSALLKNKGCRIIQMVRRNRVKAVISRINARRLWEKSGYWNLYNEADRPSPLEVDLDQFAQYLQERIEADQKLDDFVSRLELPTFKIIYEDLLVDRDAVITKVFDFLRVKHFPVEGKSIKATSDDLRQAVKNFDELRACYTGTIYAPMFDEVLAPSVES